VTDKQGRVVESLAGWAENECVDETAFWIQLEELLREHAVVIDRPRGTSHPQYPEFVYPLDYGYLAVTSGGDGNEIDIWCGSGDRSVLTGAVCTVDRVKNDAEIKLIVGCTANEAEAILQVHNSEPQAAILVINPRFNESMRRRS
jgi:inorganic pyrophosphatase